MGHQHIPPPHPRREPRVTAPLTADGIAQVFEGCADFGRRTLYLGDNPERAIEMLYIVGQVRNERASDYVLRPLTQCKDLAEVNTLDEAYDRMAKGCLYSLAVSERTTADEVVFDLVNGWVALFFPGKEKVLTLMTATEEKRSISPPDNEPDVKGAMDCFVESVRTNTSLVRRRLRAPELRVGETLVGRQSVTPVDILYIKGIADPQLAQQVEERVKGIDIDAMLMTGNLEQYMSPQEAHTPFPLSVYTQRPDRFCAGLAEGRVGVLVDGIPMGWLYPATLDSFYRTGQDRSTSWMVATALSVLRYVCMLLTLFLPGLYVAAVLYHPELIPVKLMMSIIAAKADVPFSTLAEVLVMLIAFEVVQEAGLRLPAAIGQTVSILGGLVVGTAAVEAKLVSPAVLVMVAIAGIAGYTAPSQDFSGALRLWRFGITLAAGVAGLVGLVLAGMALVYHLACLESFGVAYLTPFASCGGSGERGHVVFRQPLPRVKTRPRYLNPQNRRNQG
ncbi:MAG TPA: spore germination protein [Candidatus Enterenecus avicola]|nr:spore germination protein [Candidatus Enterenecus avicola]